jgi:hypothetical protein
MFAEIDGALHDPVVTNRAQTVTPAVTVVVEIAQFPATCLFCVEIVAAFW